MSRPKNRTLYPAKDQKQRHPVALDPGSCTYQIRHRCPVLEGLRHNPAGELQGQRALVAGPPCRHHCPAVDMSQSHVVVFRHHYRYRASTGEQGPLAGALHRPARDDIPCVAGAPRRHRCATMDVSQSHLVVMEAPRHRYPAHCHRYPEGVENHRHPKLRRTTASKCLLRWRHDCKPKLSGQVVVEPGLELFRRQLTSYPRILVETLQTQRVLTRHMK